MPSAFDIQELSRLASELWKRCETERLSESERASIINTISYLEAVLMFDDVRMQEAKAVKVAV